MKLAFTTTAVVMTLPLLLLAQKDTKIPTKVPEKSGISIDVTVAPPKAGGAFSFKIVNSNDYPVHVSGDYTAGYSWHEFKETVKANDSTTVFASASEGPLGKITVQKVEKIEKEK